MNDPIQEELLYGIFLWCKKCDRERGFSYYKSTQNVRGKGNRILIMKCSHCGSLWHLPITSTTKFTYKYEEED